MTTQRTQASTLTMILLGAMLIGMAPTATAQQCSGDLDDRCTYPDDDDPFLICTLGPGPAPTIGGFVGETIDYAWTTLGLACGAANMAGTGVMGPTGDIGYIAGTILVETVDLIDSDNLTDAGLAYLVTIGQTSIGIANGACVLLIGEDPSCQNGQGSLPQDITCPEDAEIPNQYGGAVGLATAGANTALQNLCTFASEAGAALPSTSQAQSFVARTVTSAADIPDHAIDLATAPVGATCWFLFGPVGCDPLGLRQY